MADSQDTASARSLHSDMCARISELGTRVPTLENSLAAAARREREKLQSQFYDYKYPVLTLPTEIPAEIFINFLPAYPGRPPFSGLPSPALLGQICQNWRQIAFNTPRLWRAIHTYISSGEESTLEAQLILLTTWLSRSKNCSLSLSLGMDVMSPKLPHFTAALISQSERWEHIQLLIPFDDLRWLDRPFPLLRDLTFEPVDDSVPESAIMVFREAPQLKSVVFGVMFDLSQLVLPWSQLTSITAEEIEPAVAADMLAITVPPLIHLESLLLHDCRDTQKLLLDALTAPALRQLPISEPELGDEPLSTITAFLSRSRCSLQSLHATHAELPLTAYRAAFPSIPIIELKKR
ncbi:hypothetical protein C8J57DRAFT_1517363 [Mycena rebaudengoi]|nr:hypothetical protein C8J57DRAFT_1517363 [Mycena rebaudengoi]